MAVLHADFMAGGQCVGKEYSHIGVEGFGQVVERIVGKRRAHVFGLGAVDHIAHNPAAFFAAVGVELFLAIVASTAAAHARYDHFIAFFEVLNGRAHFFYYTDGFVAENAAFPFASFFAGNCFDFRVLTLHDAQIRTANGGFGNADDSIGRINDSGNRAVFEADIVFAVIGHGFHGLAHHALLICLPMSNRSVGKESGEFRMCLL